jgi:ATP-dependent Clp protease protease subunit
MPKISKEWIEVYFEYGVDNANRRVFLFNDVSEVNIGIVIKGLYFMDSEQKAPIELYIGSFGGSEYDMFALYDVCRTLSSPIHTIAIGKSMSAAPLLVAGGEPGERWATPNTYFMIHEGEADVATVHKNNALTTAEHIKSMSERWYTLMAQHTKKSVDWWRETCAQATDLYLTADKALELGIIDHIWDEKS